MRLIITLTFTILSLSVFAQSARKQADIRATSQYFTFNQETQASEIAQKASEILGLNSTADLQHIKTVDGVDNQQHHRYKQYYKGIAVMGGELIGHTSNGIVNYITGNILPEINLLTTPSYSANEAIEKALVASGSEEYYWERYQGESLPTAELCIIDKAYPEFSGDYQLAYKVNIYSVAPLDKSVYFLDAHTGQVVQKISEICQESVPASGLTLYYGERDFVTDSIGPNEYHLIDRSRGNGNTTYRDTDGRTILTDSDNYWDLTDKHNHSAAIDAHFATAHFYDLLLEYFGWEGLDGQGRSMDCVVNYRDGTPYLNAFWDGNYAWFGDGDCHNGPLTSIDVVAHEFAHGLTDFTSDLVYMDEPGALNEAMSDIFGKACEYYIVPDEFTWYIGETFNLTSFTNPFRYMADPSSFGDPEYYRGNLWHTDESDNGGVHTNSGVLNYWFYLLVDGGSGINEKGFAFDVQGLGMETAVQIPFLMQSGYLTRTSNYNDAYNASILATESLYGAESPEMQSVKDAWKVVGLPLGSNQIIDLDLAIEFEMDLGNTCFAAQSIDVFARVSNVGIDTLFAEDTITIIMNNITNNPFHFVLTEDFVPGQDSLFVLEGGYQVIGEGRLRMDIELTNIDKVQGNNSDRYNFFNYFSEDLDVSLSVSVPDDTDCFVDIVPIPATIRNSSCNPIAQGTPYSIAMSQNGQIIDLFEFETSSTIPVGGQVSHVLPFEYPGNITILDFELIIEDTDESNNYSNFQPILIDQSLSENYLNELNVESEFDNLIYLEDPDFFGSVEYNGEFYMGTSGTNSNPEDICPFFQDNFTTNGSAFFEMCVDFEEYENVVLSFDLVQLRNEYLDSFPEYANSFCMAMVEWNGALGDSTLLITDQVEGELYHYDMDLPDHFTGYIKFQFYNHIGSLNFNAAWALDRHDFNLLDNLEIKGDAISNTTNIKQGITNLTVSPNPASDIITVSTADFVKQANITIYNLAGDIISQDLYNPLQPIDISQFSNGMYIVVMEHRGKQLGQTKFIKH